MRSPCERALAELAACGGSSYLQGAHFRLRTPEEALRLAPSIAGMLPEPSRQQLGVVELLLNAIEHGNLEIDGATKRRLLHEDRFTAELERRLADPQYAGRYVDIRVERTPYAVEVLIEDQGPGFCWEAYGDGVMQAFDAPLGRGIALARCLAFDDVSYLGKGNRVLARVYAEQPGGQSAGEQLPGLEGCDLAAQLLSLLDSVTEASFWSAIRVFLYERLDSPVAFAAYVDGQGGVVVPEFALSTSTDGDADRVVFPRQSWGYLWGDPNLERTVIENEATDRRLGTISLGRSIAAPVVHRGAVIGWLHVANKLRAYTHHDARRLETLASRISSMVAARLSLERLQTRNATLDHEQERVSRDHELAQRVISKMLRANRAALPGVRSFLKPLDTFSGDAVLVAETPSGDLRWLLADFVGHGLAAALGSIPLASAFHATAMKGVPLAEVVLTLNEVVRATLPTELFCGAVICEFERSTNQLSAWNGGMPPLLVVGAEGRLTVVDSEHLPLGVVSRAEIRPELLRLEVPAGDRVIAFSDGITEAPNARGEQFGLERALGSLTRSVGDAAVLWSELQEFVQNAPRCDDMSVLDVCPSEWLAAKSAR